MASKNGQFPPSLRKARSAKYNVGYGKPPVAYQYQPGKSGNPKGRPKGAKNKNYSHRETKLADIILNESQRGISIQENGKKLKISIAQAIVRSLNVNAAKGDTRAQKLSLSLINEVELKKENSILENLAFVSEYKTFWEQELEQQERYGNYTNDPIPHPDDLIIDTTTGEIQFEGPIDKKEKAWWDDILQKYVDLEASVFETEEMLADEKNKSIHKVLLQCLQYDRSLLQTANNAIGKKAYIIRNKSKLKKSF